MNRPCCYTISNGKKRFEENKFYISYNWSGSYWDILRAGIILFENSPFKPSDSWDYNYYKDSKENINGAIYGFKSTDGTTYNYELNSYFSDYSYSTYGLTPENASGITTYTNSYLAVNYGDKIVYLGMRHKYIQIVPDYSNITYQDVKENSGTRVLAPKDNVILYRMHSGDQKGTTRYYFCPLRAMFTYHPNNSYLEVATPSSYYNVHITDITWSEKFQESHKHGRPNIVEQAYSGFLLVGRQHFRGSHNGDENDDTAYAVGRVEVLGKKLTNIYHNYFNSNSTSNNKNYWSVKESSSWISSSLDLTKYWIYSAEIQLPKYAFITGRYHNGDENKTTWYSYSYFRASLE